MKSNKRTSKKISREVEALFENEVPLSSQIEIWFQDESRIGQQGSLT